MTTPPNIRVAGSASLGGKPLLSDLDLELASSAWTALLGPSGSGKSTILRLIAGLDTGVTFDGHIATDDAATLSGRVAYMAQDDLLLPWLDLRGNVALGARLRGEPPDWPRIDRLIAELGLGPQANKRPATLSGGQRQRAALARTLVEDRPVVLLDEPFSALDARARADLQALAARWLAGRTVLIVTHDPAEAARLADRIWLLERGRAAALDPPPGRSPRPLDDPETLAWGGRLLARLRADA